MRVSGGGASAAEGKREFGGRAPDAEEIFYSFLKKYAFLSILRS